ncbi:MAG: hypothetical protein GOVbin1773_7 [Prokaryotic dsDNA virus sp.]|jgi:hypothetical protein|nr:MAG: hypothetical protein GOVbin1773_7 [Prokaryotic dsDNA virus sp.]|tara:strand:- start:750 stop:1304 length:555 start_codon:yes stop_codon:yes gene_type:complete
MKTTEQNQQPTGYQLMLKAEEIVDQLYSAEGELTEEIVDSMDKFIEDSDQKLDQYRYVRQLLQERIERAKKNADQFNAMKRRAQNELKQIDARALALMEARMEVDPEKGRRYSSDHGLVYITKRQSIEFENEDEFIEAQIEADPSLINEIVSHKIDKIAVKSRLKNGETIDGVSLVDRLSVTFK